MTDKGFSTGGKRVWILIALGAVCGCVSYFLVLTFAFDHYERALAGATLDVMPSQPNAPENLRSLAADMLSKRATVAPGTEAAPTPETLKALEPFLHAIVIGETPVLATVGRYFLQGTSTGTGPAACNAKELRETFAGAGLLDALKSSSEPERLQSCIVGLIARYLSAARTVEDPPMDMYQAQKRALTISQFKREWVDFALLGAPKRDESVIVAALHTHFKINASQQVQAILSEAVARANERPDVERARLLINLIRGFWQCLLFAILFCIIFTVVLVRLSDRVLPGARRRLAWFLDSATAFGLAGTVNGLILALFEIKSAMTSGSSVAFAGVLGGMALAFSTTLIGVAIERFGRFIANGHDEVPG